MIKSILFCFFLVCSFVAWAQERYSTDLNVESVKRVVNDAGQWQTEHIKAWRAMVMAVQPDGMLEFVQPIGDAPQNVSATKNEVYGTAALMLAGLEVARFIEKN